MHGSGWAAQEGAAERPAAGPDLATWGGPLLSSRTERLGTAPARAMLLRSG
jgi:hypothetical protein